MGDKSLWWENVDVSKLSEDTRYSILDMLLRNMGVKLFLERLVLVG